MRPLKWALIQYDWSPYEKTNFGHRHSQKEDHVKKQGEQGHLGAEERGLRKKTNHANTLILAL